MHANAGGNTRPEDSPLLRQEMAAEHARMGRDLCQTLSQGLCSERKGKEISNMLA